MRITLEDVCQSFAVKGKNEIIAYTFQNKKGQSFAVKDFFLKLYTFQKKKTFKINTNSQSSTRINLRLSSLAFCIMKKN